MLLSSILYELLSEIDRGKTSELSQTWSHAFLNYVTTHSNQGKTGANGGPKWRQIWTFLKLLKKIAFSPNRFFFRRSSLGDLLYRTSARLIRAKYDQWKVSEAVYAGLMSRVTYRGERVSTMLHCHDWSTFHFLSLLLMGFCCKFLFMHEKFFCAFHKEHLSKPADRRDNKVVLILMPQR